MTESAYSKAIDAATGAVSVYMFQYDVETNPKPFEASVCAKLAVDAFLSYRPQFKIEEDGEEHLANYECCQNFICMEKGREDYPAHLAMADYQDKYWVTPNLNGCFEIFETDIQLLIKEYDDLITIKKELEKALRPFANLFPNGIVPKNALERKLQEWSVSAQQALSRATHITSTKEQRI